MQQLQSLPSELLLAIALHVPQPALSGLAHSCRRLNEVLTPLLYESVLWQGHYHARRVFNDEAFFWQHEYFPTERAATRQTDASIIPSSGSRIFDLGAFTRTVLSSESLRSLVRNVDLRWHNEHFHDDDSVRCCLQALESSHLRVLHLSPADFFFEIPARPAVTSLALQIDPKWTHRPQLYAEIFERLYTLFCIPSLIHFRLDGWSFWTYASGEGRAWAKPKSVGASNIEDLSLSSDGTPGDDLREVLSWPKALKRFTFLPHRNPHYEDSATVCSELQLVLQHQRLTLEYLHAGVPNCNSDSDISESLVLPDFPALKYLHICVSVSSPARPVCISDYENDEVAWKSCVGSTLRIIDALSSGLDDFPLDPVETFSYLTRGSKTTLNVARTTL